MSELSSQATSIEPLDPEQIGRILVIRPRFVGDICLAQPVVDHLRRHAPHAEIDFLVDGAYASLLEGDPRLGQVIPASRSGHPWITARQMFDLSRGKYDLVIDLYCNPRTALWTAATRASVRVGYPNKGWRSGRYNRFVHPRGKSAVHFHLASIEALGWEVDWDAVPRLAISDSHRERMRGLLAQRGIPREARLVILNPGARWPTRRWGWKKFAELARRIVEERDEYHVLIHAGPGEESLAQQIVDETASSRCQGISGLALGLLAALSAEADAFVSGDTGPIHVSVASGTPTVGIFGKTEPERFFPYPASHGHRAVYTRVWCSPCDLDFCSHTSCLASINQEMVWRALVEILDRKSPWPGKSEILGAAK